MYQCMYIQYVRDNEQHAGHSLRVGVWNHPVGVYLAIMTGTLYIIQLITY